MSGPDDDHADRAADLDDDRATSEAFAGGAPLDSVEEARAEEAVGRALFGGRSPDPVTLGRFRILEPVGRGGMGLVYAAWDPELERRVAIKVVRVGGRPSEQARDVGRERLLAEARAAARLAHPNVVAVHDAGVSDGRVFIAMEYVDGTTLRDHLASLGDERPARAIADVFQQAARGLWAAHQAGLVHRDFKPANVLISTDEAGRHRAQVADFGLAAVVEPLPSLEGSEPDLGSLTRDGAIVGTPAYMSPEQHVGEATDPRSDQYSFCVALFEALHGELPFPAKSLSQLRKAVLTRDPPRMATHIDRRLAAALDRGLARDPAARFDDMGPLVAALDERPSAAGRWLAGAAVIVAVGVGAAAGRPQPAAPQPCRDLDAPWVTSIDQGVGPEAAAAIERADTPTAATTGAAVAAAVASYRDRWVTARLHVCRATHHEGTQSDAQLAFRVGCLTARRLEMQAVLQGLATNPTKATMRRAVDAVLKVEPPDRCTVAEPDRAFPPPTDDDARARYDALHRSLATLRGRYLLGDFKGARQDVGGVLETAREVGDRRSIAQALELQAALESRGGDLDRAVAASEEALGLAIASEQPGVAANIAGGLVFLEAQVRRDTKAAERIGSLALAWADAAGDRRARAAILDNLGIAAALGGSVPLAVARHREALALESSERNDRPSARIRIESNLAAALTQLRTEDARREATERLDAVLELAERTYGPDHVTIASLLHNRAALAGKEELCRGPRRADVERALAIKEANYGPDALIVTTTLKALAFCDAIAGDYPAAAKRFARAVEIGRAKRGDQHPSLIGTYFEWGVAAYETGRYDEAERIYDEGLAIAITLGDDTDEKHRIGYRKGELLAARGDLVAGRSAIESALASALVGPAAPSDVALYRLTLARMYTPDNPAKASEHAAAAAAIVEDALEPEPEVARQLAEWHAAPKPWVAVRRP